MDFQLKKLIKEIKEDMTKKKPLIYYSAHQYGTNHLGDFENLKLLISTLKNDYYPHQVIINLHTPDSCTEVDLEEFAYKVDDKPCWSYYPERNGHFEWITIE